MASIKTKHDGDCTIYAALENIGMPEAGICTCGYGHQYKLFNNDDDKELYSQELRDRNTMENLIVRACKKVVDAQAVGERAQATYELDCLMCEIKDKVNGKT